MVRVQGGVRVERTVEETFDYAADWRNEVDWNELAITVEKVTPGPIGQGTRFKGTYRQYGDLDLVIAEYQRPHRQVLHGESKAMRMVVTKTFTPVPGGATMHKLIAMEFKGVMKLAGPLMGGVVQRQLDTLNVAFKRAIEGPQGEAALAQHLRQRA